MELKRGYKQTDIGLIPEDWDVKPLGQLATSVEYGSSAKSDRKGHIPVLRMGNLQGGKIDWKDLVYTSNEFEINKYQLRMGDILFNRTNTIDLVGKTSIFNGEYPAIFAGYLIRINFDKTLLNPRFLNYSLNAEFSRKYSSKVLSVAVGQANINGQKLKTYPIPLPPTKTEQDAIAEALSDVDTLLEALMQVIAKKRLVKQGLMQELLTGKRRLLGFNEEWEIKHLRDIAFFYSGGTPSTNNAMYYSGDIPWITSSDLNKSFIHDVEGRITKLGLENSSAKMVNANSLLVALYGATAGVTAITKIAAAINQAVLAIVPHMDNQLFLYYKLNLLKDWIIATYTQGGQPNLSSEIVKSIEISLPKPKEQEAIVEILSDMDAEISALETRREKTSQLKEGMMQELLTGRTRLI